MVDMAQDDDLESLLEKWRKGENLELILGLLQSDKTRDRLRGAYYLNELGGAIEGLKVAATQLADDPLSHCRQAFVQYIATAGYYDRVISVALAKCLLDLDLYVRATTIKWATQISAEKFDDFSRLVESGESQLEPKFRNPLSNDFWNNANLRRGKRAVSIIRRIRDGEEIQIIRDEVPEEDSFVFDSLNFSKTRRERLTGSQNEKS